MIRSPSYTGAPDTPFFPRSSKMTEPTGIQCTETQLDQRIGIDLGARKCCVAAAIEPTGDVLIVPTPSGSRTIPAYVAFSPTGRLIGEAARDERFANAETTMTNIKRLCGRTFNDPIVSQELALMSSVVCSENGRPEVVFNVSAEEECNCMPELLLSLLLAQMKQTAESFLDCRRVVSVISVPPSLDGAQRAAILDAASVAGLPVVSLISDPLASALAFRQHEMDGVLRGRTEFTLLVVDVGACTSDASVVRLATHDDNPKAAPLSGVSLLATAGSATLGGIDFDRRMCYEVLLRQLRKADRATVRNDRQAMRRLMGTAEQLKCSLSACVQANVELAGLHDEIGLFTVVKRQQFEACCEPLFEEIAGFVSTALQEASLGPDDIDEVLLLGGCVRIPRLRRKIDEIFSFRSLYTALSNDEAIACGLVHLRPADLQLKDLNCATYGIRQASGLVVPTIRRRVPLPVRVCKTISTFEDKQEAMTIEIYEGERAFAHQNRLTCLINVTGIPPGVKGSRSVQVTLKVDHNGILSVISTVRGETSQATSFGSFQGQISGLRTTVDMVNRIKKEDVRKMIFQTEHLKMDDELQRMRLRARDELEALANNISQMIHSQEVIDTVDSDELVLMECSCSTALTWLAENPAATFDDIDKKLAYLRNVCDSLLNN